MVHTSFKEAEFLSWFDPELDLMYLSSLILMENTDNSEWGFFVVVVVIIFCSVGNQTQGFTQC